jgi:hypothetical protein
MLVITAGSAPGTFGGGAQYHLKSGLGVERGGADPGALGRVAGGLALDEDLVGFGRLSDGGAGDSDLVDLLQVDQPLQPGDALGAVEDDFGLVRVEEAGAEAEEELGDVVMDVGHEDRAVGVDRAIAGRVDRGQLEGLEAVVHQPAAGFATWQQIGGSVLLPEAGVDLNPAAEGHPPGPEVILAIETRFRGDCGDEVGRLFRGDVVVDGGEGAERDVLRGFGNGTLDHIRRDPGDQRRVDLGEPALVVGEVFELDLDLRGDLLELLDAPLEVLDGVLGLGGWNTGEGGLIEGKLL